MVFQGSWTNASFTVPWFDVVWLRLGAGRVRSTYMSTGKWHTRERDIQNFYAGAKKAGVDIERLRLRVSPDGTLEAWLAGPSEAKETNGTDEHNPWDQLLDGKDQAEAR